MSVYPINLLFTQLAIACQEPLRLTKVTPTLLKLDHDWSNRTQLTEVIIIIFEFFAYPERFERAAYSTSLSIN